MFGVSLSSSSVETSRMDHSPILLPPPGRDLVSSHSLFRRERAVTRSPPMASLALSFWE